MNQMQWRRTPSGHLALYLLIQNNWVHHRNTHYYRQNPTDYARYSDGWATFQSLHKQGWQLTPTPQEMH